MRGSEFVLCPRKKEEKSAPMLFHCTNRQLVYWPTVQLYNEYGMRLGTVLTRSVSVPKATVEPPGLSTVPTPTNHDASTPYLSDRRAKTSADRVRSYLRNRKGQTQTDKCTRTTFNAFRYRRHHHQRNRETIR